jgi:hypothetical protein
MNSQGNNLNVLKGKAENKEFRERGRARIVSRTCDASSSTQERDMAEFKSLLGHRLSWRVPG